MNLFGHFRRRRDISLTTTLERQRLTKSMPGQTAAVSAARLGCLVL